MKKFEKLLTIGAIAISFGLGVVSKEANAQVNNNGLENQKNEQKTEVPTALKDFFGSIKKMGVDFKVAATEVGSKVGETATKVSENTKPIIQSGTIKVGQGLQKVGSSLENMAVKAQSNESKETNDIPPSEVKDENGKTPGERNAEKVKAAAGNAIDWLKKRSESINDSNKNNNSKNGI